MRSFLCTLAAAAATSPLSASSIDVAFVDRIMVTQANATVCGDQARTERLNNQEQESLSVDLTVEHACELAAAAATARQRSSLGIQAIHAAGECVSRGQAGVPSLIHSSAVNLFQL